MCARLAQSGYDVTARDRDPEHQPDAENATARLAARQRRRSRRRGRPDHDASRPRRDHRCDERPLWFGQAVATAEALLIGRKAGIELSLVRNALAASAANSDLIRRMLTPSLLGIT